MLFLPIANLKRRLVTAVETAKQFLNLELNLKQSQLKAS